MPTPPCQQPPFPSLLQPRPALPLVCSTPTIGGTQPGTVDLSTATVEVVRPNTVPPTGWSGYRLEICGVSPAGGCTEQSCTPVLAPPTPTVCTLTGLNQSTT